MKKIAIFSDIHGNLQALNSILKDIDNYKFDEVICLGDVIGGGPNSKECLDLIMDSTIKMVKGNHEIYQVNDEIYYKYLNDDERKHRDYIHNKLSEEELEFISNLPMSYEKLIEGNLFTFNHFILDESKSYFESLEVVDNSKIFDLFNEQETNYMFIGHCHSSFQISSDTRLLTCAGSSGCRRSDTTFYTILEIDGKNIKISRKELAYDKKSFEKSIKDNNYPNREKMAELFFGIEINKK